jgi:hypothetical protein
LHLWGPNCAVHDMDRAKRPPRGGVVLGPLLGHPMRGAMAPWCTFGPWGVHLGCPGTLFGVSWDVSFGGYPLRGVLELCLNMTWRGRLGPQITCFGGQITCFGGQITCFGGQITCFQAFSSISCPKLALGVVFRDPKTRDFGVRSEITLVLFGHVFGVLSRQIGVPPITLFGPFWQCRYLGIRGLVVRVK